MFKLLESQAPAKQNAENTITTLSGRLQSATLLEDRRAAILGLRSFAKLYPASVASGALKNLISSLNKDVDDVDTTKVILETLLMLFNPDESSPEASDDIALWLADEFTQRQENITALLDLLDSPEFFSRLYSLQLISAISTARPERTQECVYTAPLGVSRLVAILEDKREAVRSEGLLLLTALTPSSPDLQKLVAFENAFDRIFGIIDKEGGLTNGGITVQDCLSLLSNLLRLNVSNQSYFRETGWVKRFTKLLSEAVHEQDAPDGIADWARPQRDKNLWGLLVVLQLFLVRGSVGTQANQLSFWQTGTLTQILDIAFRESFDVSIRAEALSTAADLIRSNPGLQEGFAQLDVFSTGKEGEVPQINGEVNGKRPQIKVNVISGLLDLALTQSSINTFDVRLAACNCLKAYLCGHAAIRLHFVRRAIEGYMSDDHEADNILTILIGDSDKCRGVDPYRLWIAAVLLFHLLYEDLDTKNLAIGVAEGDAEKGEEVITCIQALSANLISGERNDEDPRASIGYLMILCGWLFEDHDAVNDFLGEGSNVQSIVQLVTQNGPSKTLVSGLCALLLGIVYEFSTKDSPIPRATLHQILISRLGREQYVNRITKLRESTTVRDFEVLPQGLYSAAPGDLPQVFFDRTFVDFLKDNFSRITRAIDRPPGIEVAVVANGVQKGVSRELVDSLKSQVDSGAQKLQRLESDILTLERKLAQEQADHRKAKDSATAELSRIKNINNALQRNHEDDMQRTIQEHQLTQSENHRAHEATLQDLQHQMQKQRDEAEADATRIHARNEAEVNDLKATIDSLRSELDKTSKEHVQDLQTAHEDYSTKTSSLEARLQRAEDKAHDADARAIRLQGDLDNKEAARKSAQAELDDMLIVLGDIEEKRSRDKKRLKELNEPISDGEEGEEHEIDEEDEPSKEDNDVD
ncbi:Vesicle-mediated ER to Golgi transport protein [Lecanora helva]